MNTMGRKNGKKGSVVIESALLLPMISLLMVGILEFGDILMIKQTMTNAARESTRAAAIQLDTTTALAQATTVAEDYLERCGIDMDHVTVDPRVTVVNGSEAVQVHISYSYTTMLHNWIPGVGETMDLRSQVTMRREA